MLSRFFHANTDSIVHIIYLSYKSFVENTKSTLQSELILAYYSLKGLCGISLLTYLKDVSLKFGSANHKL